MISPVWMRPRQKLTPRINYDYFVGQLLRSSLFSLFFLSFSLLFFLSSISLGLNLATSGRAFEWNLNFACKFFLISRGDWFVNDKIIRIIGEVWNKIFWNKIMEIQYNFFDFNSYCFRSYLTTNYNYNSR